ncbi:MAG: ATP-binding protein [Nocardioides sp.]
MDIRPSAEGFLLAATPEAPRLARHRVSEACAGLGDELRTVAELLTSELVTNAVRHPPRDEADDGTDIEVRIHLTDEVLRVEVHDHDSRPLPEVRRPTTPSESGMGLHLIDELAAAWGADPAVSGAGKMVWFEIRVPDDS